jgi:hypothetical protein
MTSVPWHEGLPVYQRQTELVPDNAGKRKQAVIPANAGIQLLGLEAGLEKAGSRRSPG